MARNLQRQGQLDLAFETYRRCPASPEVLDALHGLGLEFDARHQGAKAKAVFTYMAERDPKYKHLADRPVSEEPRYPRD